jgi:hypothetical protein
VVLPFSNYKQEKALVNNEIAIILDRHEPENDQNFVTRFKDNPLHGDLRTQINKLSQNQ